MLHIFLLRSNAILFKVIKVLIHVYLIIQWNILDLNIYLSIITLTVITEVDFMKAWIFEMKTFFVWS